MGVLHLLPSRRGIPQGDPLSALAFCICLAPCLDTLNSVQPDIWKASAFADDVLLCTPADQARQALHRFRDLLLPVGLELNLSKTGVWSPSAPIPPSLRLLLSLPPDDPTGLTLCGLPVQSNAPPADPDHDFALPCGTPTYTQGFLDGKFLTLRRRLQTLHHVCSTLGPNTGALHAMTHVLRLGIQGSFVHLFRFLPPSVSFPWADQLDALVLDQLSLLLELPLRQDLAHHVLRTPFSQGGLQIPLFRREAAVHFLSGALALQTALPLPPPALDLLRGQIGEAAAHLQTYLLVPLQPLLEGNARTVTKKIRMALADHLGSSLRARAPWLIPPNWAHDPPENPYRLYCQLATAWLTPRPGALLFTGPFRLAIAMFTGLPVFPPGCHCRYTTATSGRPCALLGFSDIEKLILAWVVEGISWDIGGGSSTLTH